jgi:predicted dienelactone hydrolase
MKTASTVMVSSRALVLGALALGALAALISRPAVAADTAPSTYKVGVVNRRFIPPGPYDWRGAQTHALLATVWYPAAATAREEQLWIGDPRAPLASAGSAARRADLAPAPRRFPLIVISHGTGGSALAMAWLGSRLAARGFIAVAVNHPGNDALEPYTAQGFSLWWLRARDLSSAIDGMLADRQFGPRIDARRIAAAGFSLGGYTMMEIAGGRTSSAFFDFCSSHPRDGRCAGPPEFPTLAAKVHALLEKDPGFRAELRAASASYRDPRVRAVFAIAPANGAMVTSDSLASITVPVEIVAGSADTIEPVAANARYFAAHVPGSRLILFPGAGHYTFFATCTALGRKAQPALCEDAPGIDRARIHERAAALAVAFFAKHLT